MSIFLALLLAAQVLSGPNQNGTIAGVLRDSAGRPAAGIRVGAIAVPDSTLDVAAASAMVSLAETDAMGRYRLESVPPGRYYIAAGRVDFPTYYPGTQALARGTVVSIASRAVVGEIDFALQDSSRPSLLNLSTPLTFYVPLQVAVEGGGKLPVFSPNGFMFIGLTNAATGVRTDIPVNVSTIVVPSQTAEYRVSVENVPAGYRVKSMLAGTADVAAGGLKLSTFTFTAAPQAASGTQMVAGTSLSIVLTAVGPAQPAATGVRVSGQAKGTERRSIYISGRPGIFYSDGTFEFRGVAAGRHTVASIENPESTRPLGASVVVGNSDVQGVELEELRLLPMDIRSPSSQQTRDAGRQVAGSAARLASLQVIVVDEGDRQPAGPGTVYVTGPFGTSFDLPEDGRFEIPRLLPGNYSFEIQVFRHASVTRTIVVDDRDISLELGVASVD